MKKLLPFFILALAVTLTGCGAIQKQNNIDKQMENLVFNAPANQVYDAAVKVMSSQLIKINSGGKTYGASDLVYSDYIFGGKKNKQRIRFTVAAVDAGKGKSTLRIHKEKATNFMGEWGKPHKMRFLTYEYQTLQKVDAAKAAKIDKLASKK